MRTRFWGSALLVGAIFAALVALVTPYEFVGAQSDAERRRVLLLILWTAGVMALCFGSAGLLASVIPLGFRDVAEKGSVEAAMESRRNAGRRSDPRFYNFAGWVLATGASLIAAYFAVWVFGG